MIVQLVKKLTWKLTWIVVVIIIVNSSCRSNLGVSKFTISTVPYKTDTITREGYTLLFQKDDTTYFEDSIKRKMIETFFTVYPKLVKEYNPEAQKKVVFILDPVYKGIAITVSGSLNVHYNPEWFYKNPQDVDVVTHEIMHIVQAYPDGNPWWITEGIADYVRYTMGVANEAGNWSLPLFNPSQHYENSYRVTAKFFVWLTKNTHPEIIKELDNAMRTKTYSDDTWKKLTGKTVDELWTMYAANPA